MFDTMTITKVLGAVCGSLLVYLLGAWAAEGLYTIGGGHGEEHQAAYVIDTGADEAPAEAAGEAAPDFATLYAAADAAAGEKVFAKCKACHKMDGANATGPHLNGVVDRGIASLADFAYSDSLKALSAKAWSAEELNVWLENPKAYAPGNKMSFAGLPKIQDRANIIAYLAANP